MIMEQPVNIYIARHRGIVGCCFGTETKKKGFHNIFTKISSELYSRNQRNVNDFFKNEKPDNRIFAPVKFEGINTINT